LLAEIWIKTPIDPLLATATNLQAQLAAGTVTSACLVQLYLTQIARHNGYFKSVIATAPEDVLVRTR
jgi:amidase